MLTSPKPSSYTPTPTLLLPLLLLPFFTTTLTTTATTLTTPTLLPTPTLYGTGSTGTTPFICPNEEADWCKEKLQYPEYCCNRTDPCTGYVVSSYCPITCGICPEVCGGKKCKNLGTMDYKTCTCQCSGATGGPLCEDCVGNDEEWCTTYKPRSSCGKDNGVDPLSCPYFCGLCPDKCGGKQCAHYGTVNVTSCGCICPGGFTGSNCEKCPVSDEPICVPELKSYCDKEPYMKYVFRVKCPHLCGICP